MKVKITSDSTCDLSPALIEQYNIGIAPLTVNLGDNALKDGVEINPEDIYAYVEREAKLPTTSAVNVSEYTDFFSRYTGEGYAVVHFCISSEFSACCQNARLAAEEQENVYVVDSRNLSTGQGLLVLRGAELAAQGMEAADIADACAALADKVEASFVVDSIDYLYKGGRCSALAAFGANLLQLKPCIEVADGKMHPGKKFRGRISRATLDYVTDRLKDREDIDKSRVFITYTAYDEEDLKKVRAKVQEFAPDFAEVLETTAGCTVTCHCGPGTLGVLFIRK